MAFVKKTWKDRLVQYANRRLLTKGGGETEQVTVTRDEGTVYEAGDKFDAATMNNLENRISAACDVQVFNRFDVLLNSVGGTVRGFGAAMITMQNGIARIDFNLKITTAETVQNVFSWGINRDYFTAVTGKQITPQAYGSCVYYDANNVVYEARTGLGGTFLVNGQFWQPARVYNDNGTYKVGGWASAAYQQNSRIVGTCWGTYT